MPVKPEGGEGKALLPCEVPPRCCDLAVWHTLGSLQHPLRAVMGQRLFPGDPIVQDVGVDVGPLPVQVPGGCHSLGIFLPPALPLLLEVLSLDRSHVQQWGLWVHSHTGGGTPCALHLGFALVGIKTLGKHDPGGYGVNYLAPSLNPGAGGVFLCLLLPAHAFGFSSSSRLTSG